MEWIRSHWTKLSTSWTRFGERLEAQHQQEIEDLFQHDGTVAVTDEITGTMVVLYPT